MQTHKTRRSSTNRDFWDESSVIARIQSKLGGNGRSAFYKPVRGLELGIGDDAAILHPSGAKWAVTTDAIVDNVHFQTDTSSAKEIGHKALAVNLSDLAAMGAVPRFALLSLGLPRRGPARTLKFVDDLVDGFVHLAKSHGVALVGGNVSQCETLFLDVTLIGDVHSPLLRSSAREGDLLAVTGTLGEAAAGLEHLRRFGRSRRAPRFVKAQVSPTPHCAQGELLARLKVRTAIDLSDGFASELHHLCAASSVTGALVDAASLPISNSVLDFAKKLEKDPLDWALYGGEDYRLLFTLPPSQQGKIATAFRKKGFPFYVVGSMGGKGVRLRNRRKTTPLPARGWKHHAT